MDIQTHRKQRLRELMDYYCAGKIRNLAEKIARTDSYVGRMFYAPSKRGAKPVGDKMSLVIEGAFTLERAWLDKPLGYGIPGKSQNGAHVAQISAENGATVAESPRILWPFRLVTYQRLLDLRRSLGAKAAQEAIADMDKQLDIVAIKWERDAQGVKSRRAA